LGWVRLFVAGLVLYFIGVFFYHHVVKFFRIKDFATFQALNKFGVFVPGDNSYSWMFAGGCHHDRNQDVRLGCSFRRL